MDDIKALIVKAVKDEDGRAISRLANDAEDMGIVSASGAERLVELGRVIHTARVGQAEAAKAEALSLLK